MTHLTKTLIAAIASCTVVGTASATLVAHWKLDEGSSPYTEAVTGNSTNSVDQSSGVTNSQAGIAPDGGTSVRFANDGGGSISVGTIEFDGDYVAGSGDGTQTVLSNFSVTSWINLTDPQTGGNGDRVFFSTQFNSSNGLLFGVRNSGGLTNNVFVDFGNTRQYSGIGLDVDKDYLLAVVRDPSGGTDTVGGGTNRNRISVYDVDADTWITAEGTQNKSMQLKNMTIGAFSNDLNGREFDGLVDDVRIYDHSLTTTELEALIGSAPVTPGDTDGDGDIDDSDLGTSFANYTGPVGAVGGKSAANGDTDGDGDVDDSDLGTSFSGYTGPLSTQVPEPSALVICLTGVGLLLQLRPKQPHRPLGRHADQQVPVR